MPPASRSTYWALATVSLALGMTTVQVALLLGEMLDGQPLSVHEPAASHCSQAASDVSPLQSGSAAPHPHWHPSPRPYESTSQRQTPSGFMQCALSLVSIISGLNAAHPLAG